MKFKNFFKKPKQTQLNAQNINTLYDFENKEDCRHFLCNLYIEGSRLKAITLSNGYQCKVEDIPEDQITQRAKELRAAIYGKPEEAR